MPNDESKEVRASPIQQEMLRRGKFEIDQQLKAAGLTCDLMNANDRCSSKSTNSRGQ
ncbi:MAG: hypothetical protein ACJ72Z_14050 [Pyrinomonadaceae bacterium]